MGANNSIISISTTAVAPCLSLSEDSISPVTLHNCPGELSETIQFDFSTANLPAAVQTEFKSDVVCEWARVEFWMANRKWPALARPNLCITVSDRFRISKSLVPAWSGNAGHMQFPTWRVAAREAAIAHELIHVLLPNGNRLLAEGLAVYVQAEIGGNPAFPNFGRPLHGLARELVPKMVPGFRPGYPASLEAIHLNELDAIATPGPLTLQVGTDVYGEEPRGQAHVYPLAGSFVQYLIETRGLEAFRRLYALTPLVPLCQNAGLAERWTEVYGSSLQSIQSEWRTMIAG